MGWFDKQIEFRKKHERELLNDSFEDIAYAVIGQQENKHIHNSADYNDALSQLLKYFHIKQKPLSTAFDDLESELDYQLSASGILYREVLLTDNWQKDAMGVFITTLAPDGCPVTVVPNALGHYVFIDPHSGTKTKITSAIAKKLGPKAFCFYRPFPQRALTNRDLFRYMAGCLSFWDFASFGLASLCIVLLGLLIPKLNHILVGDVVTYGSHQLWIAVVGFMLFASIGSIIFSGIRSLLLNRISVKLDIGVRAAAMMRVLSMPAAFFKDYTSGELNQYLNYLNSLSNTLIDSVLSTGVTGIFSLVYFAQIFTFARSLVLPSLVISFLTLAVSLISSNIQSRINKETMRLEAKERGLVFTLINGIQKIRLSGAENRAFVKWADIYSRKSRLIYSSPLFVRLSSVITVAITMAGTAVIYFISVKNGISVADYYAFNASYAYLSSAFSALAAVAVTAATLKPGFEIIKPFMDAEPEISEGLETVSALSGQLELSHVTFRYAENEPYILEDISLTIPAHQYVAIVGRSGCGKSTLMRLLLGFEKPEKGAIYYDKRDTKKLDMASVRRQIGTVMQDGKLFGGSIFENIVVSAPNLALQDAWDAAEIAGIAEDIRAMPMGMNTVLQEGICGISGGQRQRLMIARAVAPKPKLLMFDEATSALDNITQKQVADALDAMHTTRIVIAHRLSTIRHCDRIIVLDGGKIIEDGTYDELIKKKGFFADLVKRQLLDDRVGGAC